MPDFFYKALNSSGAVEEGWMTAPSEVVVEEQLRRNGTFLINAEERSRARKFTDGRIDRRELLAFLEYMAGSFTAGLPLLTTLDDVPLRLRSPKLKIIVKEVRHSVSEDGKSLSEALSEHPKAFPQLFISTIAAGEASGQLAFALTQLVDYMDWQENISASVRQAIMYPIVVMVAVVALIAGLIGFVFPRILPILQVRSVQLPLPTKIIMWVSNFVNHNLLWIFIAAVAVTIGVAALRRTPRGRLALDRALLAIPGVGPLLLEVGMARVVTYLGVFYRSGVDLLQALMLVENMSTNKVVANVVRDARERIAAGETISGAFGRSPLVPIVVMRSLALGETTGKLDESLERAKLYYAREIPAVVRRMITLIQPAMVMVLGGMILIVALAIMLPILNIYNSIGRRG